MCYRCVRLKSEGVPRYDWPLHSPPGRKKPAKARSRTQRIDDWVTAKVNSIIEIPAHLADVSVRRNRMCSIRKTLGIYRREFARLLGLSEIYIEKIEIGKRPCTMHILLLAEKVLRDERRRLNNIKRREQRRLVSSVGPVPISKVAVPDDPKLRIRAVSMYIRGGTVPDIAKQLALRPEIVQKWVSGLPVLEHSASGLTGSDV